MKIAIVHDWINGLRGGEKCLEVFLRLFPKADLYTLFYKENSSSDYIEKRISSTSFLQKIPNINNHYKKFLPFFPLVNKSLKVKDYDLVISLSHASVKNINTKSKHICYCFTPMRYIWDQKDEYLGKKKFLFYPLIKVLQFWDKKSSKNVNQFIAISKTVQKRISKNYNRDSVVIYPPVEDFWFQKTNKPQKDYFLIVGAQVKYKKVDLAINAFNELGFKLIIAGKGPENKYLKSISSSNIEFIDTPSNEKLLNLYQNAKALIFPGIEDFGIVPLEAMAAGTPVIYKNLGGVSETVLGVNYKISDFNNKLTGLSYENDFELESCVKVFLEKEALFLADKCIARSKEFNMLRFELELKKYFNLGK